MDQDLPYTVEYLHTGVTTKCNKCNAPFRPSELRFAEMVQSKLHDGKEPIWYHNDCFFQLHHPKFSDEIENFERLKYDDQLVILTKLDPKFSEVAKKRAAEGPLCPNDITNFGIEYSTSNEDNCFICKEKIFRNEIRIKKTIYDSEVAAQFGKEILWNHMHCFVLQRDFFVFNFSGEKLPGFEALITSHQDIIREALPSTGNTEDENLQRDAKQHRQQTDEIFNLEETIAKQNEEFMRVRQALQKVCSQEELHLLLVMNDSNAVEGINNILDRCADILTFGALYKCQKCFQGDMIFTKHGYTCNGMVDEWVMCGHFEDKPLRMKCIIPDELRRNSFFATCEPKAMHRAVRPLALKDSEKNNSNNNATITGAPHSSKHQKKKVSNIKLKNGTVVDPDSKLDSVAHVFNKKGRLYTSVLCLTDITKNKNSYFKLQVLEADGSQPVKTYWLFNSWGRIGTSIGGSKVEAMTTADLACARFEQLYEEQTGNDWNSITGFRKYPGKFYPIDVDYNDNIEENTAVAFSMSPEVEELMKLLFNVNIMKETMKEFHLDLEKMPLGKLSVRQLQSAYFTLAELEDSLNKGSSKVELIGLSNKFYTLVPHNFGLAKAPIIETLEKINEKREMIDSLMEIQTAYSMMTQSKSNPNLNSFDAYYKQLNADVVPLDRNALDFHLIDQFVRNTQVHGYKIEILEAFAVSRHGEKQRYEKFKNLHNRQLLWHGSRLTNFASIISNGLKIIAQVNGSMFGRGIYFADMVSKSANYCVLNPNQQQQKGVALLVLCEVALGTMYELRQATNIVQPPPGMHSVKGIGTTQPNPQETHTRRDGVIIPLGKPINATPNAVPPGLLFNEYIVYNEAQVNIQYLVKVNLG